MEVYLTPYFFKDRSVFLMWERRSEGRTHSWAIFLQNPDLQWENAEGIVITVEPDNRLTPGQNL